MATRMTTIGDASLAAVLLLSGCGDTGSRDNQAEVASPMRGNQAAPTPPAQRPMNNQAAEPDASETPSAMKLDAQGLRASEEDLGTGGRLRFGISADLAVEILNHIIGAGPAQDASTTACGPAPTRVVRWAAGFSLVAREGRFIGWGTERPPFAFPNGIGAGSTLRELAQAFPIRVSRQAGDTAFSVSDSGVGGTIAGGRGDARILTLHAGAVCDPDVQPTAATPSNAAAVRRR